MNFQKGIEEQKNKYVLILMPILFYGGSEKQVRYIIEGLEQADIRVIVLIENGKKNQEENLKYISMHKKVNFVFLELDALVAGKKTAFRKMKSVLKICIWLIKQNKFQKIQWVMLTNFTGLVTVPLCKMLHYHVLFNERNPGIEMCKGKLKKKLLKMCDKVVANSKSASEYMSQALETSVECINNGIIIPETAYKIADTSLKKEQNINILVPARITPIKNQIVIIKALQILVKELSETNIILQFAGAIEDENYYNKLERIMREFHLEHKVQFLGFVTNMEGLYNKADIVILSSYKEGTPNVLLEAFANRKLCLASDIVMNRDICMDKRILFEVDNYKQLYSKIRWLININSTESEEILKKNYKYVCDNYRLKKMQNKYVKILSED